MKSWQRRRRTTEKYGPEKLVWAFWLGELVHVIVMKIKQWNGNLTKTQCQTNQTTAEN